MFLRTNNAAGTPADKNASKKSTPSVIASDFNLLGNIICDGIVDFDGKIDGNIRCQSIVVRKNGVINGEISAQSVQVHGRVIGMIRAEHVSLFPSCTVEGIIMHQTISIADGAVVDGKIKRTEHPSAEVDDGDSGSASEGGSPRLLEGFKLISGSGNS